jgi:hypothetical protein
LIDCLRWTLSALVVKAIGSTRTAPASAAWTGREISAASVAAIQIFIFNSIHLDVCSIEAASSQRPGLRGLNVAGFERVLEGAASVGCSIHQETVHIILT